MGSSSPAFILPDASSPTLVLTRPTPAERIRTWSLTHANWGPALTLEQYLERENYMTTVPLARDGGMTHWILTDASLPPDQRPILSSCESLRKPALCCRPAADGGEPVVVEGVAHAIGSVFTDPKYRGRGYARRMMQEVGRRLRDWQAKDTQRAVAGPGDTAAGLPALPLGDTSLFSVLYSDIGKTFYARSGWAPFPSTHVSFPPLSPNEAQNHDASSSANGTAGTAVAAAAAAQSIGYHELAELCAADERRLREKTLPRRVRETGRTCVALAPSLDVMLWHLMREDFMTKRIFGRTPTVRGAVFGSEPGRRVWAVWTRGYYGGPDRPEGNTFHILRLVVEDDETDDERAAEGLRAVVEVARREAAEWKLRDVQMWNPEERLSRLVERTGLPFEVVHRDMDSIPSLMWYGEGSAEELDWVLNEKYGWC